MKKLVYITSLFLIILSGCTERIEIDLGTTYTRFVVDGVITTDTMKHAVKLSKSIDYYDDVAVPGVSNAQVTIYDGYTTITLEENDSTPGLYETTPDYFGVPGRTYDLEIELEEAINGYTNYSSTSFLNEVAPIDSINVVYLPEWEAWELQIYAWDPIDVNFYLFDVYKNGIHLTDTLNEVGITDDKFFNGNFTYGVAVYYFIKEYPEEEVFPGDSISLRMGGITNEYFNFVIEMMSETFEFNNPLFSGPPANVSANISNEGLGFFTAYDVSYSSVIYSSE